MRTTRPLALALCALSALAAPAPAEASASRTYAPTQMTVSSNQTDDCQSGATCTRSMTAGADGAVSGSASLSRLSPSGGTELPIALATYTLPVRLQSTGTTRLTWTWTVSAAATSAASLEGGLKAKAYLYGGVDCSGCQVVGDLQAVSESGSTGLPVQDGPRGTTFTLIAQVTGRKGQWVQPYTVAETYVRAGAACVADPDTSLCSRSGGTDGSHAGRGSASLTAQLVSLTVG